jgi:hypothetical protein
MILLLRRLSMEQVAAQHASLVCTIVRRASFEKAGAFAYLSWPWRRAIAVAAGEGSRDVDT